MLHTPWSKAAVLALLDEIPFCWIATRRDASIAGMDLEPI